MMKEVFQKIQEIKNTTFIHLPAEINEIKSDSVLQKKYEELKEIYFQHIKDASLEVKVAFLHLLFNNNGREEEMLSGTVLGLLFIEEFLNQNHPDILRAVLVLESLKDEEIDDLYEDDFLLDAYVYGKNMRKALDDEKEDYVNDLYDSFYSILISQMRKVYSSREEIQKTVKSDVLSLADHLLENQDLFFTRFYTFVYSRLKTDEFVTTLLKQVDDEEELNQIYHELLEKNLYFKNFPYNAIPMEQSYAYVFQIKGFLKRLDDNHMKKIIQMIFQDSEENTERLKTEKIKKIIELNQENQGALCRFFIQMQEEGFTSSFLESEVFTKYNERQLKLAVQDNVTKLLYHQTNLDDSLLDIYTLHYYEGFSESGERKALLEKLKESFEDTSDEVYRMHYIVPILLLIIEEQKKRYGVDFILTFEKQDGEHDDACGFYDLEHNTLYINLNFIGQVKDMEYALALFVQTVFHETRHVKQDSDQAKKEEFSWFQLLVEMDDYVKGTFRREYYGNNYRYLFVERDAHIHEYVDMLHFFDKYPNWRKKGEEIFWGDFLGTSVELDDIYDGDFYKYGVWDFVRRDVDDQYRFRGIVSLFKEAIQNKLDEISFKKISNPVFAQKEEEELREFLINNPAVLQFFDVDMKNLTIQEKSEAYFKEKVEEIMSSHELEEEKNRQIEAISMFLYAVKVGDYLEHQLVGNSNDLKSTILENVGGVPLAFDVSENKKI